MSSELTHSQVVELLPAYVVGALESHEMLEVDNYLQTHPNLLPHLRELKETVGWLVYTAPDVPLPADNKQQVLALIQADIAAYVTLQEKPEMKPGRKTSPSHGRTIRFSEWWAVFWRRSLAAAGTVLALLIVSFYISQVQTQLGQANAQMATMHDAVVQLQHEAQESRQLLALLANPNQSVRLAGTEEAPGAHGTFYRNGDQGVFVVGDLPPLPSEQTYQLWLVVNGEPMSVGLLEELDLEAPNFSIVSVPVELHEFTIVDVSVEPAGGSPTLLGPVVLRGIIE
jgi:anti-sigma-K factor RskA